MFLLRLPPPTLEPLNLVPRLRVVRKDRRPIRCAFCEQPVVRVLENSNNSPSPSGILIYKDAVPWVGLYTPFTAVKRRWSTAGESPARELVRSTR